MKSSSSLLSCLLVDDDPLFRDGLSRAIRGLRLPMGMDCRQAGSAEDALDLLESQPAALVFLDFRMPGISGLDGLRRIRLEYPQVPIIMITGEGDEQVAVEAMKAGAADYLVKGSLDSGTLRRAIINALQKGDLLETIRRQKEALLEAERHRVMIESLGAAYHHLGQPASLIRAYLEMAQKESMSAPAREMMESCLQAADSMAEILKNLQKISEYRTVPYFSSGSDSCRILDV